MVQNKGFPFKKYERNRLDSKLQNVKPHKEKPKMKKIRGDDAHSAVASQPFHSGHIPADKKEIKGFSKLLSATSFIS